MANTFMTREELDAVGFSKVGRNVYISRNVCIHGAENMELGSHVRVDDFCFLSGKKPSSERQESNVYAK